MKTKLIIITVKYHDNPKSSNPGFKTVIIDNTPPNKNLGFAGGINQGIRMALRENATHVLLLTPDVTITNEQINELLRASADIVSPVLKFKRQGKWVYDFGGKINWILGRTTHIENGSGLGQNDKSIDYVSGACMLIKNEIFEKIGLFDEDYFMYFEDVDFCLRAKRAGFTVSVAKNVVVVHQISEHRVTNDRFKISLSLKSNWIFVNKHIPWCFKPTAYSHLFLVALKIVYNLIFAQVLR